MHSVHNAIAAPSNIFLRCDLSTTSFVPMRVFFDFSTIYFFADSPYSWSRIWVLARNILAALSRAYMRYHSNTLSTVLVTFPPGFWTHATLPILLAITLEYGSSSRIPLQYIHIILWDAAKASEQRGEQIYWLQPKWVEIDWESIFSTLWVFNAFSISPT